MHSESEVKVAIRVLLERYGPIMNMSEIKENLHLVLDYDRDDLELSETRPGEIKIKQIIGNIVCHQINDREHYYEGYVVDKTVIPAVFTLVDQH